MPPLKSWPEWIKAAATAALASVVTIFGMGVKDGTRQATADATTRLANDTRTVVDMDIQPRLRMVERLMEGQGATLTGISKRLDDLLAEIRRVK